MTPRQEIIERGRRNVEGAKRTNAIVCLVIGGLFGLFALGCFIAAALTLVAGLAVGDEVDGARGMGMAGAISVGAFGLFWCALTVLLVTLGRRGLSKLERAQRLRTSGVRGTATVISYVESNFQVDGETNFQLAVRIALDGRPPWDMSLDTPVVRGDGGRIYQGATLPVLVNPANPAEVMVVWD